MAVKLYRADHGPECSNPMATKADIGRIAARTFPGRESAAFACHTARHT